MGGVSTKGDASHGRLARCLLKIGERLLEQDEEGESVLGDFIMSLSILVFPLPSLTFSLLQGSSVSLCGCCKCMWT
jgi:hypothetical protein